MKKIISSAILSFALYTAHAQTGNVGINTSTPAATLDVVGQAANSSKLDGVIAPRLTGQQLYAKNYTAAQTGALVYATAADTNLKGQTVNVTAPGYYVFDGSVWQSISTSGNYQEPWNVSGTNTPATANTQNIYQNGNVSIGQNAINAKLSVYQFNGANNSGLFYGSVKNNNLGTTPWLDIMGNLSAGSYSNLTDTNDIGLVFSTDNNEYKYSDNGFIVVPHSGGGGATTLGYKLTEQGLFGIGVRHPSETFDVNGTARLRLLPANGATNAIYTNSSGANSLPQSTTAIPAPTQTFNATRTVVADNNGVLGYVNALPGSSAIVAKSGTLTTGDATVLATGDITLPPATTQSGKIYNIVYNGTAAQITSSIQVNGSSASNFSLDGTSGKSGVTLQSDGTKWYLISRY